MRNQLLACLIACSSLPAHAADLIDFWNTPRHGGNSFNRLPPDQAYFEALHGYGASWVRLSYDKWQAAQRDFLLGNADTYQGLPAADLATLKATLDRAHAAGLKVVITPLSLPGMRWAQNNAGQFDDRLWQDKAYWAQAADFWRDLARALKDHPAVAAYNLINEPAPEKLGGLAEHASAEQMHAWYRQQQGSTRDLPALYRQLVAAIREVDPLTPIMLDAGWYAAADAFEYWPGALDDQRLLYSFHMYEPYAATSAPNLERATPYAYPGPAPFGGSVAQWNKARVQQYLYHLSGGCTGHPRSPAGALGLLQLSRRQLGRDGLRAGQRQSAVGLLAGDRKGPAGPAQAHALQPVGTDSKTPCPQWRTPLNACILITTGIYTHLC